MKALDADYTFLDVSQAFDIPKITLRDHYQSKRRSRKMGGKGVLTEEEDEALAKYILDMVKIRLPLIPNQMKEKVVKMTQERSTPFKKGMLGRSWLRWFLCRHSNISLRSPQVLEQKRAKSLNPSTTRRFFQNLSDLYEQHQYKQCQIWNLDESSAMANKNGTTKVLAKKGARTMQTIAPGSRKWITVLSCVNAVGQCLPNFYIFKGVRNTNKNYTILCEEGATQGLQKKVEFGNCLSGLKIVSIVPLIIERFRRARHTLSQNCWV